MKRFQYRNTTMRRILLFMCARHWIGHTSNGADNEPPFDSGVECPRTLRPD
jgi:hypothetical protein